MARSRKKTPIRGNADTSDKSDKSRANRRERRVVKTHIATEQGVDVLPQKRELSDVWTFAKDGKRRYERTDAKGKILRK